MCNVCDIKTHEFEVGQRKICSDCLSCFLHEQLVMNSIEIKYSGMIKTADFCLHAKHIINFCTKLKNDYLQENYKYLLSYHLSIKEIVDYDDGFNWELLGENL